MRSRSARAGTVALGALAVALLLQGVASPSPSALVHLPVTGYAQDVTSTAVLDAQAAAVSTVGVDGVVVDAAGDGVSAPSAGALRLEAAAHAKGLHAVLLVSNFVDGASPTAVATRLLQSRAHRGDVVVQLVALVRRQHWDGLTVDLEALAPSDATGLVALVASLHRHLGHHQLAVDVSATTSMAAYAAAGYHLAGLARVAQVVLMAYDEDGPWSGPGPVGGLPWQRAALEAAAAQVPGRRLVLGVGAYGYTWPSGARVHDGTAVTVAQARRLAQRAGRAPTWVAAQGEYTVRLRDGTVLWWADSRSYLVRARLAARLGLAGLAVWQLATADQLPPRGG